MYSLICEEVRFVVFARRMDLWRFDSDSSFLSWPEAPPTRRGQEGSICIDLGGAPKDTRSGYFWNVCEVAVTSSTGLMSHIAY